MFFILFEMLFDSDLKGKFYDNPVTAIPFVDLSRGHCAAWLLTEIIFLFLMVETGLTCLDRHKSYSESEHLLFQLDHLR